MKKFAGVFIAAMMLVLCFTLSACGNKYTSSYSATLMVRANTANEASVSFDTFNGTYVMKLENKGDADTVIAYNVSLEEGNVKVYYDFLGNKVSLFEVGDGDSMEGKIEATTGKTIYFIIESDGMCRAGSFSFALEKTE